MRRVLLGFFFFLAVLSFPQYLIAEGSLAGADALVKQGGTENFLKAADMYAKASDANPASYEAAWKACHAYREYCNQSKEQEADDWQGICKKYAKIGMKYGERAIALQPNKIEGNFWYGCCVGNYADGVSVLTALREGLKDKTQASFEKSYAIDKMYHDGGPIKALGRYWYVLPWPMNDKQKSLDYLKEYHKLFPNDAEGQVYLAEVLIDTKNKDEAKALLEKTALSPKTYYSKWAKRLLGDL
ncbi:MAG TPA: tetratricopeptide repeat protein [Deltaproteobacteria bacterium]|nr:tetratricopeptide repeat protein [Deltaproteobacteria bacterium]HQJ08233.1 tetratricopeptide repeat protein [Deltaproteobacteria bacterium]